MNTNVNINKESVSTPQKTSNIRSVTNAIVIDSDHSDEDDDQKICLIKEYETINKIFDDILKIDFEESSKRVDKSLVKFNKNFQISSGKKPEISLKKDPLAQR